ncbi:MAG TPA: hypothetical protein VF676_11975 [Flavobacterium sp.]|jgi:hypothetical protein
MKNQIALVLLLLVTTLQMSAQKSKINDVQNASIVSWGTKFTSAVSDTKWSNVNGKSYTKAKYADFTGETSAGMSVASDLEATINLELEVKKGALRVIMEDEDGNPIFDKTFANDGKFSTDLTLFSGVNYKIRFMGERTKGSYFCQWIQTNQQ